MLCGRTNWNLSSHVDKQMQQALPCPLPALACTIFGCERKHTEQALMRRTGSLRVKCAQYALHQLAQETEPCLMVVSDSILPGLLWMMISLFVFTAITITDKTGRKHNYFLRDDLATIDLRCSSIYIYTRQMMEQWVFLLLFPYNNNKKSTEKRWRNYETTEKHQIYSLFIVD